MFIDSYKLKYKYDTSLFDKFRLDHQRWAQERQTILTGQRGSEKWSEMEKGTFSD